MNAAQCRAGRALLSWSQEELARNAQVARTTIAEFEGSQRMLMRQNRLAIESTMEAAGVEFIPDNGGGVGVRFRKVVIEYSRNVKTDAEKMLLPVRYRGHPYTVLIPHQVIAAMDGSNPKGDEARRKALSRRLPICLRLAENKIVAGRISENDEVWIYWSDVAENRV